MNLTEELQKLAALREAGHLTDEEFAAAKRRLLADGGGERASPTTAERTAATAATTAGPIEERVYWSSRWSAGNLFFPDRLTLAADGLLFRKGAMFGSSEEHISYRAVASYKVANGIFLTSLTIETSGGSQPIYVNGLWKSDAQEIQEIIRAAQRSG